jgi:hypothetical protein
MVMMLAPSKTAGDENHAAEAEQKTERRQPQQKPAGSANPEELDPSQI